MYSAATAQLPLIKLEPEALKILAEGGYKVPHEIVFLDELPRTPTGKILKRELAVHTNSASHRTPEGWT